MYLFSVTCQFTQRLQEVPSSVLSVVVIMWSSWLANQLPPPVRPSMVPHAKKGLTDTLPSTTEIHLFPVTLATRFEIL